MESTFFPDVILFDSDDPDVVAFYPEFESGAGGCFSAKFVQGLPDVDLYGVSESDISLRRRLVKAPAWLVSSIRPEIGADLVACGGRCLAPARREVLMREVARGLRGSSLPGSEVDLTSIWDEGAYQQRLQAARQKRVREERRRRLAAKAEEERRRQEAERRKQEELYAKRRLFLEEQGVRSLHHLTHVDNLESIQRRGLLPRSHLQEGQFENLADHSVLRRRLDLTDFVPLYLAEDTPMFHVVRKYRKSRYHRTLVLLEVDLAVLQNPGALICSQNAATRRPSSDWERELGFVDWDIVVGPNRGPAAGVAKGTDIPWEAWKKQRMAEVLIPGVVPWAQILSWEYYR